MLSHQQFHISHRAILADSSLQNCFNAATLAGFWARNACLRSTHSISVGIQSGRRLGCSKPLYFVFNKPFRGGPTGAFRVIVLQHNPSALRLEAMNRWPDGLFQNILVEIKICVCIHYRKSSRSWSNKAAPDHHTTVSMMLFFSDAVLDYMFLQCSTYVLSDHKTISAKVLMIKMFLHNSFFGQQWILPSNFPIMSFLQSLFNAESWTLTFTEASEGCSGVDVGWVVVVLSE